MTRIFTSSALVLACGLVTLGCASPPVPILYDGLDTPRYLRCNILGTDQDINSSNFIGDGIVSGAYKPGSQVVVSMYSPQRVDLSINKIPHKMHPMGGEFPTDVDAFLTKYFVSSLADLGLEDKAAAPAPKPTPTPEPERERNPLADEEPDPAPVEAGDEGDHSQVAEAEEGRGWRLDLMKPSSAQSVKGGIAAVGMTKEQVFMALGPPTFINHDTPACSLGLDTVMDANRWIYYSGWGPKTFTFGLAGKRTYTFDGANLVQVQ
jgi:hypothetical protein